MANPIAIAKTDKEKILREIPDKFTPISKILNKMENKLELSKYASKQLLLNYANNGLVVLKEGPSIAYNYENIIDRNGYRYNYIRRTDDAFSKVTQ